MNALVLTALAALALTSPAGASPGAITAQHETEHRVQAAVASQEQARLAALSPAERERIEERAARLRARALAVPPEEGGAWSPPFPHRSYGMHASLLPTGKVLFWSVPLRAFVDARPNTGLAWLWDPAKGTGPDAFTDVDPPLVDSDGDGATERAPLYCSGQSFLPDGRLLVTGGNRQWPDWDAGGDYVGWEGVLTFNPFNEAWARQPDMADGRWYPTQVLTGHGETFVASGWTADPLGAVDNTTLERFTPAAGIDGTDGRMDVLGPPDGTRFGLYPHLFPLRDGTVAAAGQGAWDVARLDTATGEWDRMTDADGNRPLMSRGRNGGTAVLEPAGPGGEDVVTGIGGWEWNDLPLDPATATTETIDFSPAAGSPRWQASDPLHVARANHNTVLLPDGGMVTVGGGSGRSTLAGVRAMYDDGRSRAVELRDAGGGPWRLGAAQAEDRGYHSTALLLPDGRVLSSGDDAHPTSDDDTIELYSPPYLFKGDRPSIDSAPAAVGYDRSFVVGSDSPGVERAVLMAPSATTHGNDMTQRHVELQVLDTGAGGVTVRSPRHGNLAPPGYYMLFLLDGEGVPSVASWVRLDPAISPGTFPEDEPPATAPGPVAQGPVVEPPRVSPPPAVVVPPQVVRDGLAPALRLRVSQAALRTARRTGRLRFSVSVDERATVVARLTARGRLAGTLRRTVAAGTHRLTLKVAARRRKLLRRRPLTLSVTASDARGNSRRVRSGAS